MSRTHRQLMEVHAELSNSHSWKMFQEYLKTRIAEQEFLVEDYSSDLSKLLVKEQAAGSAKILGKILTDFQSHVSNVMSTTKEEDKQNV